MSFHPSSLPDLTDGVFVVTGGTSGIGFHTCAHLAQKGAHVYLCGRNLSKGDASMQSIKNIHPACKLTFLEVDHLSIASVQSAAKVVLSNETRLDGLVNNAGIMMTPFEITQDGYEAQWQTNYIAHWMLTTLLIPLMLKTSMNLQPGSVRVVNLTSSGHWSAPKGGINFEDTSIRDHSVMTRYGQSKLANVLHAKTLHKRYGPGSPNANAHEGEIWISAVHPGLVKSNIATAAQIPLALQFLFNTIVPLGSVDADTGSFTSLFCLASPEMKATQSGTYFQRVAEAGWQSAQAKNAGLAVRLEDWTVEEMKKGGWIMEYTQ